jgi:hypothetical protein
VPSPFPGMDPYLETPALWPDFSARFNTYLRDTLFEYFPDNYEARINEKVNFVALSPAIEEETHERHIEILHRPDRTLVAVLELLSPANKEEPGRTLYLAKRNALALHPVHLVEVDLLLKGQRVPFEQDVPPGDYYAFVSRGDRRPRCGAYHWTMREALPAIPIPLLAPDPDVWIDLGAVFRTTYERGRYARSIDYAGPLPVALDAARLAWVTERARGSP